MALPENAIELTPDQVAELSKKLSTMRHNINNNLALIVAASELMTRKPEMAPRLVENISQQPDRIIKELRAFSDAFNEALGISQGTILFAKPQAPSAVPPSHDSGGEH